MKRGLISLLNFCFFPPDRWVEYTHLAGLFSPRFARACVLTCAHETRCCMLISVHELSHAMVFELTVPTAVHIKGSLLYCMINNLFRLRHCSRKSYYGTAACRMHEKKHSIQQLSEILFGNRNWDILSQTRLAIPRQWLFGICRYLELAYGNVRAQERYFR